MTTLASASVVLTKEPRLTAQMHDRHAVAGNLNLRAQVYPPQSSHPNASRLQAAP